MNSVSNREVLLGDVRSGRWDAVLPQLSHCDLPFRKAISLYEHIVTELIELKEYDAARTLLRSSPCLIVLKEQDAERYLRLERMLSRASAAGAFDATEAYGGDQKERRCVSRDTSNN